MKRNLSDIINVLTLAVNEGLDAVSDSDIDNAIRESISLWKKIYRYTNKHGNISLSCGSEWMFQDDDGQTDALNLVGDILDSLEEYAEPNEDEE